MFYVIFESFEKSVNLLIFDYQQVSFLLQNFVRLPYYYNMI